MTVTVEQLDDGRWRFRMPRAPGWAMAARTPVEAAGALRSAFTEAQVAAYSSWRGHLYDDPDALAHRRHRPSRRRSKQRCDVYEPTAWRLGFDGEWISPGGFRFPESRQVVQRVMAQRQSMGLAPRPDPVAPDYVRPPTQVARRFDAQGAVMSLTASATRLTRPTKEESA